MEEEKDKERYIHKKKLSFHAVFFAHYVLIHLQNDLPEMPTLCCGVTSDVNKSDISRHEYVSTKAMKRKKSKKK